MRLSYRLILRLGLLVAGTLLGTSEAHAMLFGQFTVEGSVVAGDSSDPDYERFSDLSGFSLVFNRETGATTQSIVSLTTRFSMRADSTFPLLLDALLRNDSIDARVESVGQVGNETGVIYRYDIEDSRFSDLSIAHGADGSAVVHGLIDAKIITVLHEPSGRETTWDFSTNSGSAATLPGDFDGDGQTTRADYDKWREQYGTTMGNLGGGSDANADGVVDAADYTIWRDNFLGGGAGATQTVPEPTAWLLLVAGLAACGRSSR